MDIKQFPDLEWLYAYIQWFAAWPKDIASLYYNNY